MTPDEARQRAVQALAAWRQRKRVMGNRRKR